MVDPRGRRGLGFQRRHDGGRPASRSTWDDGAPTICGTAAVRWFLLACVCATTDRAALAFESRGMSCERRLKCRACMHAPARPLHASLHQPSQSHGHHPPSATGTAAVDALSFNAKRLRSSQLTPSINPPKTHKSRTCAYSSLLLLYTTRRQMTLTYTTHACRRHALPNPKHIIACVMC